MTRPTPAEKAVMREIYDIEAQYCLDFPDGPPALPFEKISKSLSKVYLKLARWHLAKLGEALADERMGTLLSVAGKSSIRFQTALKTLRQISALPRGGRAKRLAVSALRFLENVK